MSVEEELEEERDKRLVERQAWLVDRARFVQEIVELRNSLTAMFVCHTLQWLLTLVRVSTPT